MLSYHWQGIEEAIGRVQRLAALEGLESELEAEGDEVVKEAQEYPPERPAQRYARQYILKNSWRRGDALQSGRTVRVDITNVAAHGPYVMGDEQADVHQGRWKKLRTIGEERKGALRARAQRWALRTWRGR